VFSALVPKLLGARILLDLHDPMPELMTAIFGFKEKSLPVRILKRAEKLSIKFTDRVITANLAWERIFSSRSCDLAKIQVVMNSPDEEIFRFRPFEQSNGQPGAKPFIIMYHGSIVERHGLDLAVEALEVVRQNIPQAELMVYGAATPFLEVVMDTVRRKGLDQAVHYLGHKSLERISEAIAECDLGIIPNRCSTFTELNTPTRIFEYLSRGKPVIAPFTQGITDYFGKEDLLYFELGNVRDLAHKIEHAYLHPSRVRRLVEQGQKVYLSHRWAVQKHAFLETIAQLLSTETSRRALTESSFPEESLIDCEAPITVHQSPNASRN
jgi:glycosyltransferase involved in cell wall biosynthesis